MSAHDYDPKRTHIEPNALHSSLLFSLSLVLASAFPDVGAAVWMLGDAEALTQELAYVQHMEPHLAMLQSAGNPPRGCELPVANIKECVVP